MRHLAEKPITRLQAGDLIVSLCAPSRVAQMRETALLAALKGDGDLVISVRLADHCVALRLGCNDGAPYEDGASSRERVYDAALVVFALERDIESGTASRDLPSSACPTELLPGTAGASASTKECPLGSRSPSSVEAT